MGKLQPKKLLVLTPPQFLTPNMLVPSVTFAVWISLVIGGKEHPLGATLGVFVTFGLFDILIETYAPVSSGLSVMVPNIKLFLYGALLVAGPKSVSPEVTSIMVILIDSR